MAAAHLPNVDFIYLLPGRAEQSRRSRRTVGQHGRGEHGPPERQFADSFTPGNNLFLYLEAKVGRAVT